MADALPAVEVLEEEPLAPAVPRPPGEVVAVHRTYLRPDGSAKADVGKPKKMLGRVAGANVLDSVRAARQLAAQKFPASADAPSDVVATVAAARDAGATSVSLDLLADIPDLSLDGWSASLESALALQPDHLSIYALTLALDDDADDDERRLPALAVGDALNGLLGVGRGVSAGTAEAHPG